MLRNLTPELVNILKRCSNAVLEEIIKVNRNTVYFQESPLLSHFRKELVAHYSKTSALVLVNGSVDLTDIIRIFAPVPLSVDKDYAPFFARFNEIPCRASRIRNLLAPGFPNFLAHTSGTTDGPKIFPKYGQSNIIPTSHGNVCWILSCKVSQIVDVILNDDDDSKSLSLPLCFGIGGSMRMQTDVGFGNDRFFLSQRLANITSPFAAYLIQPCRSILLIHSLFALADRSLTEVVTTFGVLFHDCVRLLMEQWHVLIEAIRTGRIPSLDGLADVAVYLQAHLRPDPFRAAELCNIIVGPEGWLKKVWPQLKSIRGIFNGPYSAVVPKLRHHVGPFVNLISTFYITSECHAGSMYNIADLNLFKIGAENYVEYLDIEKSESPLGLRQAWEIEVGRRYELVVTTHEGRWRYRLGDVLEAAGFDPTDGQPLMRYIERRTRISASGSNSRRHVQTRSIMQIIKHTDSSRQAGSLRPHVPAQWLPQQHDLDRLSFPNGYTR